MKYVVQTGSSVMTHIPSFIKTGSGIHKLKRRGIYKHTDSMVIS
jgi:hypothetical protein